LAVLPAVWARPLKIFLVSRGASMHGPRQRPAWECPGAEDSCADLARPPPARNSPRSSFYRPSVRPWPGSARPQPSRTWGPGTRRWPGRPFVRPTRSRR